MILFGGSFNPVHNMHLAIALQVSKLFNLGTIHFIPNINPPYKKVISNITTKDRVTMLKEALSPYNNFVLNQFELTQLHYSPACDTLLALKQQNPNEVFFFIIGADSLNSLNTWDNYQELFELTNFIVFKRTDFPIDQERFRNHFINDFNAFKKEKAGKIYIMNNEPMNISSSMIREAILKEQEFKHLVPDAVFKYIKNNDLYR